MGAAASQCRIHVNESKINHTVCHVPSLFLHAAHTAQRCTAAGHTGRLCCAGAESLRPPASHASCCMRRNSPQTTTHQCTHPMCAPHCIETIVPVVLLPSVAQEAVDHFFRPSATGCCCRRQRSTAVDCCLAWLGKREEAISHTPAQQVVISLSTPRHSTLSTPRRTEPGVCPDHHRHHHLQQKPPAQCALQPSWRPR